DRHRGTGRIAGWRSANEAAAQKRTAASANKGVSGALNPAFVLATLSGKISQDDIVLNEAIRNGPVLQEHVKRTKPQSYVGLAGGGLGFSGGMALGLRLARPDRRIVQVIGDGGFHFSSPDSVYAAAQQYQIPIFTLVLDNGGWPAAAMTSSHGCSGKSSLKASASPSSSRTSRAAAPLSQPTMSPSRRLMGTRF